MTKVLISVLLAAASAFAQYKTETAGAPPAEASAMAALLQKDGVKVTGPDGVTLELWLRTSLPSGGNASEANATLASIPHGALLGVIRVAGAYGDRRGLPIKAGLYTLRYSLFPINGDHQGVAPQRDFLILSRLADDKDPNAAPAFDPLMDLSRKASGTPHPICLSIWKGGAGDNTLVKEGEHDFVLNTKAGGDAISVILFGKSEG